MLQKLLSQLFGQILYIQIWEHRLRVLNTDTGESFDAPPLVAVNWKNKMKHRVVATGQDAEQLQRNSDIEVIAPFSHPRTLLQDFDAGSVLLQRIFKELCDTCGVLLRPRVIIQPMEKLEGGLTMIEQRALSELALSAGALRVHVHTGEPLPDDKPQLKALFHQQ